METKVWIFNLLTAIACFVLSLLYLIKVNYGSAVVFLFCGLIFLITSRINYKKIHKENNKKSS